jgi:hypothetical protein
MMRLAAFILTGLVGLTAVVATQDKRAAPGSDHFVGSWMVNPRTTINWGGGDNTTFEFIQFTVENDVQTRDVEVAYGVADSEGVHKHNRRRNSVRYNEFDPIKANATDVSVYGNKVPPNTPQSTENHLVTLKVDDRTHISFNKAGGGFFRHMAPDLKEYCFVGFNADGKVPLHRCSYRVMKAGGSNIPEPRVGSK